MLHHVTQDAEHWDFMLETTGVLATWRLATRPPPTPDAPIDAHQIGDHRKEYLNYEGPLTGDRGHVRRVDDGLYVTGDRSADKWEIELRGRICRGHYLLSRNPNTPADSWSLSVQPAGAVDRGIA